MEIKIRNEEAKDIEQVGQIVRAAFPTDAESKLVDALRANGKAIISLVAVNDDEVLGHILFSPVSPPPHRARQKELGLRPLPFARMCNHRGLAHSSSVKDCSLCKELGFDYCVVLGSPEYYQRFGFEKASNVWYTE